MIPSKDEQSVLMHEAGAGSEAAGRPATGDAGGGASIDKVRDLLFGGQLRELDRRFARLEERLVKETNQLRQDMQARIDALEAYARKESDSLSDQNQGRASGPCRCARQPRAGPEGELEIPGAAHDRAGRTDLEGATRAPAADVGAAPAAERGDSAPDRGSAGHVDTGVAGVARGQDGSLHARGPSERDGDAPDRRAPCSRRGGRREWLIRLPRRAREPGAANRPTAETDPPTASTSFARCSSAPSSES